MSLQEVVTNALKGKSLPGSLHVETNAFSIHIDSEGNVVSSQECDCTLKLDQDVLQEIVDQSIDPMEAYFSGKLILEGDMAVAMSLAEILKNEK